VGRVNALDSCTIATESIGQATRDAPDSRNTDTGEVVNPAIGQALFKVFHNLPAIHERLEFGGRAQIPEEIATFIHASEADNGLEERVFGARLLSLAVVSVGLHSCINVLTR